MFYLHGGCAKVQSACFDRKIGEVSRWRRGLGGRRFSQTLCESLLRNFIIIIPSDKNPSRLTFPQGIAFRDRAKFQ